MKRGVILTFYTFHCNKKTEATYTGNIPLVWYQATDNMPLLPTFKIFPFFLRHPSTYSCYVKFSPCKLLSLDMVRVANYFTQISGNTPDSRLGKENLRWYKSRSAGEEGFVRSIQSRSCERGTQLNSFRSCFPLNCQGVNSRGDGCKEAKGNSQSW